MLNVQNLTMPLLRNINELTTILQEIMTQKIKDFSNSNTSCENIVNDILR